MAGPTRYAKARGAIPRSRRAKAARAAKAASKPRFKEAKASGAHTRHRAAQKAAAAKKVEVKAAPKKTAPAPKKRTGASGSWAPKSTGASGTWAKVTPAPKKTTSPHRRGQQKGGHRRGQQKNKAKSTAPATKKVAKKVATKVATKAPLPRRSPKRASPGMTLKEILDANLSPIRKALGGIKKSTKAAPGQSMASRGKRASAAHAARQKSKAARKSTKF